MIAPSSTQATGDPGRSSAPRTAGEAMRAGVISCPPETPLRQVSAIMADEQIHCVVISDESGWGVVSDLDLLRAADADLDTTTAGEIAASDLPAVTANEALDRATQLMAEHDVAHVLVVDPSSDRPAGVLSTLDIAKILASAGS